MKRAKKSWAAKTVAAMSDAEVASWCERLGVRVSVRRAPIEPAADVFKHAVERFEQRRKEKK